jgi:hypothetical protein
MSQSRRPTTYSPDDVRANAPHPTSSPTRRWAVGSGSPARSARRVSDSWRCSSSKAPTRARARDVTEAPWVEELPAIVAVFHPAEAVATTSAHRAIPFLS